MPVGWAVVVVALWVAVIALSAVVLTLTRRVASLANAARPAPLAPPVGATLPHFPGAEASLGRARLYLFLNSSCGPCRSLSEKLRGADWSLVTGRGLEVVAVADSGFDPGALGTARLVTSTPVELQERFGVRATPYALAVDGDGVVRAGGVPTSFDSLLSIAAALGQGSVSKVA